MRLDLPERFQCSSSLKQLGWFNCQPPEAVSLKLCGKFGGLKCRHEQTLPVLVACTPVAVGVSHATFVVCNRRRSFSFRQQSKGA